MLLQDISQIDPLPRHPVRNHRDRDQEPNPVHGWNGKPEVIALEAHTLKSDRPSKRVWGRSMLISSKPTYRYRSHQLPRNPFMDSFRVADHPQTMNRPCYVPPRSEPVRVALRLKLREVTIAEARCFKTPPSDFSKACASDLSHSSDTQTACALNRWHASRNGWQARRD